MSAVTKPSTSSLAPQQARSRESLRKLLKAAAEVVGQHGLENATIPRIASHAGLTPGFWLSFGAVALLLYSGTCRLHSTSTSVPNALARSFRTALRGQAVVTVGLVPMTLAVFQQVSIIAPVARVGGPPASCSKPHWLRIQRIEPLGNTSRNSS